VNKAKYWVRFGDVIYSIFEGKWLIAALTIIALLAGILFSAVGYVRGEMSKQYKIEASVVVSSQIKNGSFSTKSQTPTKEDITLAKEMTVQAMYIMKSDKAVSAAIEKIGMVGVSSKSIRNNLTLSQYNDSQIVEISLLWRSKDEGIKILQTLEDTTNDILLSTMQVGKVVSVNDPTATYIFGGQLSISTWLIFAMLHPTLLWPQDLEEFFELEVLEKIRRNRAFAQSDPFSVEPESIDAQIASAAYILLDRIEHAGIKRLYVTSATRKEGRSTLLADWAVKLSETGKRVLLVDCDFSNPSLAPLFHVELGHENTLNALYSGESDVTDAIVRLSGNLFLLPYILEETPDSLSKPMLQTIYSVAESFDLVLIDAAPVGETAEVLRLNTIADAALLLVKYDGAPTAMIDTALTRLRKSGIPVIGTVVNEVKSLRDVFLEIKKPERFYSKRVKKASQKRTHKKDEEKELIYK